MPQVMGGEDIDRALRRMAHEILERHRGADQIMIIGIHTRGVVLARRLANAISTFEGVDVPVGELDIEKYRDDLGTRQAREPKATMIPASITGQSVVVVDDVLYTGRTIRAALDALSDIGRATRTELAVLIDRGHRQLPIRADYVGKNLPTNHEERVRVRLDELDEEQGVWIDGAAVA
jgi:pyrimidine operon attenuation protein/uracil phosphoribosyltransferase